MGIFKKVFDAVHKSFKNEVFNEFFIPEDEKIRSAVEEEKVEEITFNMEIRDLDNKPTLPIERQNESSTSNSLSYNDIKKEEELFESLKALKEEGRLNIKANVNNNSSHSNNEIIDNESIKENNNNYQNSNSYIETESKSPKFPDLKIIGQFNKTYILAEYDEVLYMIDQHAAHEKILFEKYLKSIEEGDIVVQKLLVPALIDLTTDDYIYYEENTSIFSKAGLQLKTLGEIQ